MEKKIVLKIGGSVLYDQNLNVNFPILERVKEWYTRNKSEFEKIAFVTGGGSLSRDLQKKITGSIQGEDYLHSIAMLVTQTNAALVQGYLDDPEIYLPKRLGDACEYILSDEGKYLISGGLKVGWSTDMDAAIFADILDVEIVYKISNIEYVYDSDPKGNPGAKEITDMSWDEYLKLFNVIDGDMHKANVSMPIDVSCAQFCRKKKISFFICGGKNIQNNEKVENLLKIGTLIHP